MRRVILMIVAVLVGNVVLAQAPASRATNVAAAVAARATTNNANLRAELRDIQAKLYPAEQKLIAKDTEIQAMVEKRMELQAALLDLDKKKDEKIEEKLAADRGHGVKDVDLPAGGAQYFRRHQAGRAAAGPASRPAAAASRASCWMAAMASSTSQ